MAAKSALAIAFLGILAASAIRAPSSAAAEYPARPVSFIVHSSPGSGTDITARTIADILEKGKIVPQRLIVENKVGGSAAVAINYVAGKTGDPYTLWMVTSGVVTVQPLRAKLKFTHKDFTPIAMLAKDPTVFAVRADSPFKTVKDLIAAAKEKPKGVRASVSSIGGQGHLTTGMLGTRSGVQFSYVSFKGGGEAVASLLGGHVEFCPENVNEMYSLLQAKKLRLIGTASENRFPDFPDVPTLKEQGIDVVFEMGRGVFGPKDMPRDVVKYWESALEKVVKTDAWKKYVQDSQMVPIFLNDVGFARFLDELVGPLSETMSTLGLLKE